MGIPMTDLKAQYAVVKSEIDAAMQSAINDSAYILGKYVEAFEKEAAGYFGAKYAIGVASGTDALVLALAGLGIKEGDEVITTPFTFIATAEAVGRVGAKIVFADIQADTFNIDPEEISAKITKKTKAIIPVHLYGCPAQMDKILALAKKHNLYVIEDCAQSFGSEYKGQKVGSLGICGCLSFFPAKTLGCYGDGGMVVTDDQKLAQRLIALRNHGSEEKYHYSLHGINSRLDGLQAAILSVKIKYIDQWIDKRIAAARLYNSLLADVKGIVVPQIGQGNKYAFNYYTLRVKDGKRKLVEEQLQKQGIACAVYYPLSLHLQEVYKDLGYEEGDFPVSEAAESEVLSLPMYPELSQDHVKLIADCVRKAFEV